MSYSMLCKGKLLDTNSPLIMGILNITPDSFSDGGKYNTTNKALMQTERMLKEGADIIDIGAFSSRPGAQLISFSEEKLRLEPVLKAISKSFPKAILSLDTFRASIAQWAVEKYNIAIINDISAGEKDADMFKTIAQLQVPYIIMHMQGNPETMQKSPSYQDITEDLILYFSKKIEKLQEWGVHDIIIDPGFGFGKTLKHNYQLIKDLDKFNILDKIILIGVSRKSMIKEALNINTEATINGTSILNTIAIEKGARILRVHDVKEAKEITKIYQQLNPYGLEVHRF